MSKAGVSKKKPIPVKLHCFLIIAVTIQARTAFEKDVNYRLWNSMYQDVLLRVGKDIQPNPYLAENIRSVELS